MPAWERSKNEFKKPTRRAVKRGFPLFLATLLLSGCGNWGYLGDDEYADQYDGEKSSIHPHYRVHHYSPDSSRLFFRVDRKDLLYVREDRTRSFHAAIKVQLVFKKDLENDSVIDSTTVHFKDVKEEASTPAAFIDHTEFSTENVKTGELRVLMKDKNRKQKNIQRIRVDRSSKNASQFFFMTEPGKTDPIFRNYFDKTRSVQVTHARLDRSKLFVRYYDRDFSFPPPPFASKSLKNYSYEADSLFTIAYEKGKGATIQIPEKGFLHLQADTSNKKGLTLMRFETGFPHVATPSSMLGPIRFLTSRDEYQQLKDHDTLKKAIDDFWLDCAGDKKRARKLIRHYYGRVETANKRYTSFIPGWKTDRGLIRIVYGEPDIIDREASSVTWIYGEDNDLMSLSFSFEKVENPFTNNDYALSRNQLYQSSWYKAVESWRNGRVYSN